MDGWLAVHVEGPGRRRTKVAAHEAGTSRWCLEELAEQVGYTKSRAWRWQGLGDTQEGGARGVPLHGRRAGPRAGRDAAAAAGRAGGNPAQPRATAPMWHRAHTRSPSGGTMRSVISKFGAVQPQPRRSRPHTRPLAASRRCGRAHRRQQKEDARPRRGGGPGERCRVRCKGAERRAAQYHPTCYKTLFLVVTTLLSAASP